MRKPIPCPFTEQHCHNPNCKIGFCVMQFAEKFIDTPGNITREEWLTVLAGFRKENPDSSA